MPSFQVLVLGFLFVSFHPSQFRSHSCSTGASLLFRFRFSSGLSPFLPVSFDPFCSGSDYSAFCSSFPSLPGSALQLLSRCPSPLSLPRFPLSLRPNLSCLPSRFLYSAFLFVSFRPSPIRFPQLFLRCFPFAFAFGLFRFPSGFFRPLLFRLRLLGLCFFLSVFFLFPPHSGFLSAPFLLSLLRFSPFFPAWFPMLSFPVLRTRLPVRFLSSFPASLPQLFHRCFPSFPLSLLFRAFPPAFCSLSVASACF